MRTGANAPARGGCVVVCNQQSALDPIVLLRTLPVSLHVLAMRVQGRRLHHRGRQPGAGSPGNHRRHPPDLAAGTTAIHGGQVRVVAARPLQTSGLTSHDVAALREQGPGRHLLGRL